MRKLLVALFVPSILFAQTTIKYDTLSSKVLRLTQSTNRGYLFPNTLTGWRYWNLPDTSGTLAIAESYDGSHPEYTIINASYIQSKNLCVTGSASPVHIGSPGVFIGNYDALGSMGDAGGAVIINPLGIYGYKTADGELPTEMFRIDQTGGRIGAANFDPTKIFIGDGSYCDNSTMFYVDDDGKFSISDKLYFDGVSTLTFNGTFNSGTINAGVSIASPVISGGSVSVGGVSITDERQGKIVISDETGDIATISNNGLTIGQAEDIPYYAHIGYGVGPSDEQGISLGAPTIGIDTKLYRSGANELTTPGALIVGTLKSTSGQIRLDGDGGAVIQLSKTNGLIYGVLDGLGNIVATHSQFGQGVGPSNEFGIGLGAGTIDTKLYRSGANEITTPGKLIAGSIETSGPATFAADVNGAGSYFLFTANGVSKGIVGLGGSVLGGSANNFDIYSYSGMVRFASNGTLALTLDGSQNAILAKGLTLGTSTSTTAGTIRWSGTHLEVYSGSAWIQCDN